MTMCMPYGCDSHVPYSAPRNQFNGHYRRPRSTARLHDNEPPRSQQVCLDHLKGICTMKRARCRYAHPPLQNPAVDANVATSSTPSEHFHGNNSSVVPPGMQVCEVYALTGFCKFGSQCRDYHPPTGVMGPVCAPACTWKMGRESRNAAGAVAAQAQQSSASDDNTSNFAVPSIVNIRAQTAQRLRKLCVDTTAEEAFDAAFTEAAELLSCHEDTGAVLQQLAPMLYASAISRPDGAPHVAKWCRYLFTLAPHDTRSALRSQLTSSCGNLLYHADTFTAVIALEEELEALDRKRLANARFLGHLLCEGLVHQRFFEQAVDYLLLCSCSKSGSNSTEGMLSARLLCAMLSTAGQHLPVQYGAQMAQRLRELAPRYSEEVQAEIEAATGGFPEVACVMAPRAGTPPSPYSR